MPYPVIELKPAREFRNSLHQAKEEGATMAELLQLDQSGFDSYTQERGVATYERADVETAAQAGFHVWTTDHDPDAPTRQDELWDLEARMAGVVHAALKDHATEVLADLDFWRYLHLGPFRWYLLTREPEMKPHDFGGTDRDRKYWLLIRTYLWGKFAWDPSEADPYRRATVVGEAGRREFNRPGKVIDFWHSHLVRRYFASSPAVGRSFIDEATTSPVALNDDARRFAKRMTRLSRSVAMPLLEPDDIQAAVHEQKMRTLNDPTS